MTEPRDLTSTHLYTLQGTTPVPEPDLETWARWYSVPDNRIVRQEHVGLLWVSTVFLAIDHNFAMSGPPVLFETMVFGPGADDMTDRCCTYAEALLMHARTVNSLRQPALLEAAT